MLKGLSTRLLLRPENKLFNKNALKNFFHKNLKNQNSNTQKNINNKFISIQSQNIFSSNKNKDNKDKKVEYYEPEDPLIFANGKLSILSANNSDRFLAKRLRNFILIPVMALSAFKCAKSVMLIRPVRSILWGGLFFMCFRVYRGINLNKYFFVYNVNLLEDGKRIELLGEVEPTIADITEIRKLSKEETMYLGQVFPDAYLAYIPIVINNKFYLIFKNSKVNDPSLLKAIFSGKYVKVKNDNTINKDEAIDIDVK